MNVKLKVLTSAIAASLALTFVGRVSAAGDTIRIGFITDISGVYADLDGPGGVEAIKMAIADAGGAVNGKKIELTFIDHQNKADIAASKAREWYDAGYDVIVGGTNSSASLAIAKIAMDKRRVFLSPGSGTTRLTNEDCNPYTVQYTYDTMSVARGTGTAMTKQGGKSWYFLTADVAFGNSLEKDTADTVRANGGTVLGAVKHPLSASDFSSFLLQAQASKAQVLGLATGGNDLVNAIKGAQEFGISKTMKLAGILMFISDIHALGLQQSQGLYFTDGFYWDRTDASRAWSRRFFEKTKRMPSSLQAGDASSVANYLNAVKAVGTDADKVMAYMREHKINDFFATNGTIRPDGRMVHDMFLMQVKTPAESKYPWDYAKIVQTIPGDQAYMSKAESKCAYWK
ncbi:ABC transporter substrate-binding protein [Herbaspirillum sp. RTI4]|uniref:ABC transporter substrate-binding protein n=1 Tax=Herbaspirillum sp. RTI4 TaxID=3048640 RepID=UPI002AB48D27|nr:ABC transporter substrate-binding protein [Herbaspirillum sp. RTI4]MDY7579929.1 ABC transporter substrate-binding protein [Herbaspirillum sp. RTI4]MEA9983322.1 ABC transporter substrate-binding protein [Herbaspirillum sp. RTI4]